MTPMELETILGRLAKGPVPTQKKKVFASVGRVTDTLILIPGTILVQGSVIEALIDKTAPKTEESIPRFIAQSLADYVLALRAQRPTSVTFLSEAAILASYRVPLTALFECVGDSHAIVLHVAEDLSAPSWTAPSYVRFEPTEIWRYFETTLPDQTVVVRRKEV